MIPDPKSPEQAKQERRGCISHQSDWTLEDWQDSNAWFFGLRDEITETLPVDGDEIEEVKV